MTVYRAKCLRSYLISAHEAAAFLKVTLFRFRQLVQDGYINKADRKGFFRLGAVLDGYAAWVRDQSRSVTSM
ncbi:hypothetical protein HJB77_03320 [Rhizobium lentis]|uniref:hypothetical protein n=1 Tax=Rhizobium lentis TaxID=1138194 RepID=UPI001C828434|nr:hypothetical protein [Rhizobium lentis]MBX5175326.1 hypothetical protein [Rhizobium lentis]